MAGGPTRARGPGLVRQTDALAPALHPWEAGTVSLALFFPSYVCSSCDPER